MAEGEVGGGEEKEKEEIRDCHHTEKTLKGRINGHKRTLKEHGDNGTESQGHTRWATVTFAKRSAQQKMNPLQS